MAAIAAIAPQSTRSGTNFSDTSPRSAIPIGLSTVGARLRRLHGALEAGEHHRSGARRGKHPQHPPPGRGDGATGRDQEQAGDHEDESRDPEPLAVPRDERQSPAAERLHGCRCRETRHPDHACHAEEPADGVAGLQRDDQGADEDPEREHCREDVERAPRRPERHGRRRDEHHRDRRSDRGRAGPHCWTSPRSQTETCAGCIVSRTTLERSCVSASSSTCWRRREPKAAASAGRRSDGGRSGGRRTLHAGSHGQEQRRHDERRRGDREIRAAGERREQRLTGEHEPDVGRTEDEDRRRRRASSRSRGRSRRAGSGGSRHRSRREAGRSRRPRSGSRCHSARCRLRRRRRRTRRPSPSLRTRPTSAAAARLPGSDGSARRSRRGRAGASPVRASPGRPSRRSRRCPRARGRPPGSRHRGSPRAGPLSNALPNGAMTRPATTNHTA